MSLSKLFTYLKIKISKMTNRQNSDNLQLIVESNNINNNDNNRLRTIILNTVNIEMDVPSTETDDNNKKKKKRAKKRPIEENTESKTDNDTDSPSKKKKTVLSVCKCPICHNQLGKKPLASTKCGHVFCISCLEKALSYEKKCPTCRGPIKSPKNYHPLYI